MKKMVGTEITCCGTCAKMMHENVDGYGICDRSGDITWCGDCCHEHEKEE